MNLKDLVSFCGEGRIVRLEDDKQDWYSTVMVDWTMTPDYLNEKPKEVIYKISNNGFVKPYNINDPVYLLTKRK